jgi:hypothetical protein
MRKCIFGRNCYVKCRDIFYIEDIGEVDFNLIFYIEDIAEVGFRPNFGSPSVGDIVPLSQSLVAEWGQHCMRVGSNFGCNFSI